MGVVTSIWFNKLSLDPTCIRQWPDARMYVTLHYRNLKADVFNNQALTRERNENEDIHSLIILSAFFRIKHVKKEENSSDFKRFLSLTFS